MKINIIVKQFSIVLVFLIVCGLLPSKHLKASGISIDAGLTPAYKRLIVRFQFRYLHRNNHPVNKQLEMNAYMFPTMLAYGVRSDLTVMIRQAYIKREMMTTKTDGLGDLFFLTKYRLVRINKPNSVIGIAPTIGVELPTGKKEFTSDSYDLHLGVLFSGRKRLLAADINIEYFINGVALSGDNNIKPGNEFSLQTAIAYRISVGNSGNLLFAPVLESAYLNIKPNSNDDVNLDNSGESILLLSPGLKITYGSLIIESLIQIPIWQEQKGKQLERDTGFIIGIRLMN